jgi:hypothetical protein
VPTKPGKKVNSRWTKTGQRYDAKAQAEIEKKFREPHGWRNGAKVSRR